MTEVTRRKRGRPPRANPNTTLDLTIPQKMADYLEEIVLLEGFGGSRQEVIRNFVWKEINRLIEVGRIAQR